MPQLTPNLPKPFNLYGLIATIGEGIGKWGEAYNADRDKLLKFIERYDTTISDSRMARFAYTDAYRMNGCLGVPRATLYFLNGRDADVERAG